MSRRGENIYKRKDGRWEGRYIAERTPNGKAIYKSVYAKSYAEVKEKVRLKASVKQFAANKFTFEYYAEQWLNNVKLSHKISTYNKYKIIYNLHIKPVVSNCRIENISNSHIQKIIDNCSYLSPKTVNDILCVVKMIFEYINLNGGCVNVCMKGMTVRQEHNAPCP